MPWYKLWGKVTDFTIKTKEIERDESEYDNMIAIYQLLQERCSGGKGLLQKQIIEEFAGVLSKDKVKDTLLKGLDMLWIMTPGEKNSYIYMPVEVDDLKSKSLPLYLRKKLGFLESEVETDDDNKQDKNSEGGEGSLH